MKLLFEKNLLFFLCLISAVQFSGCKKAEGCMDPLAINYNITAEKDDGSCRYCKTTESDAGSAQKSFLDYNSQSAYYNQFVVLFVVKQIYITHNDKSCGETKFTCSLKISNLVNKEIEFDYHYKVFNLDTATTIIIPANGTVDAGIFAELQTPFWNTISFSSSLTSYITYH